jgi:formylglycine-generating enzyme required for sulfatase activity
MITPVRVVLFCATTVALVTGCGRQPVPVAQKADRPNPGLVERNALGMEMVEINPHQADPRGITSDRKSEPPTRTYLIARDEVTVAQFTAYLDHTKGGDRRLLSSRYTPGMSHPVASVPWANAVAFTKWLSEVEGREYRLPTMEEWTYAALGSNESFPWGKRGVAGLHGNWGRLLNTVGMGFLPSIEPIGSFPAGDSYFSLRDMFGNVAEWCSSKPPPGSPTYLRASMGGCWTYPSIEAHRLVTWVDGRSAYTCYGFRVAAEIAPHSKGSAQ